MQEADTNIALARSFVELHAFLAVTAFSKSWLGLEANGASQGHPPGGLQSRPWLS